jgi:hypothetical protein
MPNHPSQKPVFLQASTPQAENRSNTLYAGQLGQRFSYLEPTVGSKQKTFQVVQLDSSVSVAPTAGAVAWWRDNTGYVVTTDPAIAGRGNVAGVFGGAVDVDNICCVQQGGPGDVQVVTSPTAVPGDTGQFVIPSATAAKADWLAAGSAATYPPLGVSAGFATAGVAQVELDIKGRD